MDAVDSLLCIGLDLALDRLPERFRREPRPQLAFGQWLIDQTHPYAAAYKPNLAFYEARGAAGWEELAETLAYLRSVEPGIFTIADAKRGDIGPTNAGYVSALYDDLGCDAVTLHPYLGAEALRPFLERTDKAAIVLCRTSNPGAGELQDLLVDGVPLWEVVATRVRDAWDTARQLHAGHGRHLSRGAAARPRAVPGDALPRARRRGPGRRCRDGRAGGPGQPWPRPPHQRLPCHQRCG